MVFSASNFGVTVTYLDGGANTTTRDFEMDESVIDFDAANTAALAILADIIATTDAALPRYRVYQNNDENSLTIPATTVQIENCASLTVLLAGAGSKKGNLNIPAPKAAMFVNPTNGPQNNIVNMSATIVTDFLANFTVAGDFTISDGEEISRGLSGKRVHKKSSKG